LDDVPPSPGASSSPLGARESGIFDWWDAFQLTVVFVATQYLAYCCARFLAGALSLPNQDVIAVLADQLVVAMFPVAWLFRFQPQGLQILRTPRLSRATLQVAILLALPLGCLLKLACPLWPFACGYPLLAASSPAQYANGIGLIATGLVGPVIDEVFFRGILGRSLILRYGPPAGMLLTSGIFAASRLDPSQVGAAFLLGLACHTLYFSTGTIYAPILLHSLVNFLSPCHDYYWLRHDTLQTLSALPAVFALGYVIVYGRLQTDLAASAAGTGLPASSSIADTADRAPGSPTCAAPLSQLALLAVLPFYLLLFCRLQF
jgi:membrane protease YdiL (CAAX protease family)